VYPSSVFCLNAKWSLPPEVTDSVFPEHSGILLRTPSFTISDLPFRLGPGFTREKSELPISSSYVRILSRFSATPATSVSAEVDLYGN